jgi:ABC-type dipeptide/oligopeptide/nickel transport system ATPase subunit
VTIYYSGKAIILKGIMPSTIPSFLSNGCFMRTRSLQTYYEQKNLCSSPVNLPAVCRYADTVKACALDVDISLMVGGDMAYVGEKGVNLSGGQRARLALARC